VSPTGDNLNKEVELEALQSLDLPSFHDQEEGRVGKAGATGADLGKENQPATISRETPTEGPFVVSESLPVVPAKLVRRILKAEYVDMAELLRDNMEAERRRWQGEGPSSHFSSRVSRREIPDILSWLQCFTSYAAVVCSKFPDKTRELLAYQAMMIGEARRCGGRGWLLYDAAFRQQMTSFETTDFSKINQSLYATTFLAYGGGRSKFCQDCMMADHTREECALHPNRSLPVVQMREVESQGRASESRRRRPGRSGPCYAWNDGTCTFTRCRYDHVCSVCGSGDHKKAACKSGGSSRENRERKDPRGS